MQTSFQLSAGTAMLAGAALMLITLLAHPHADSTQALINFAPSVFYGNIAAHALGMLSVPLVMLGCWGLTKTMSSGVGKVAFIALSFGMVLIVCAMTLDGLVPWSLVGLAKRSGLTTSQLSLLLAYNTVLIQSLSLVYIFAVCLAILLWSGAVWQSNCFPRWTAYYGALVALTTLVAVFQGVVLVDFIGIKIFVFGFMSWTILMGFLLQKSSVRTRAIRESQPV